MSGAYLYAWDYDNEAWVKVGVTPDGELILTTD